MNIKQFYLPMKQTIITIIICLAILAGVNLVYAWTGPPYGGVCSDPPCPPGGNVPAPINVGSSSQYKSGALGIGGLLQAPQIQLTTGAAAGKVLTSDASGLASWQTGGGASGVSQIIAGTNITISPASGTGVVTINSAGGGGGGWTDDGTVVRLTTSTDNVGVGISNPITKLDVRYDTAAPIQWGPTSQAVGYLGFNGINARVGNPTVVGGYTAITAGGFETLIVKPDKTVCINGDCRSAWPSGGGTFGQVGCYWTGWNVGETSCPVGYYVAGIDADDSNPKYLRMNCCKPW